MKESKSVLNPKNKTIGIILGIILVLYFIGGNKFKDTSDACECAEIFTTKSFAEAYGDNLYYPDGYVDCEEKYGYFTKANEYCSKNNKK